MGSLERIKLIGRKKELEDSLEELETRGANHIITIRDLIDPYEAFDELEVGRAEQAMISLKVLVGEARQARRTLKRIKKELGE